MSKLYPDAKYRISIFKVHKSRWHSYAEFKVIYDSVVHMFGISNVTVETLPEKLGDLK